MKGGCAPLPAQIRQISSRCRIKGVSHAGSSRTPLRLARRARPIWQCWTVPASSGLLPPSPASPGSGCPQLHRPAATGQRWRSLTSTRTTQRLTAHPRSAPLLRLDPDRCRAAPEGESGTARPRDDRGNDGHLRAPVPGRQRARPRGHRCRPRECPGGTETRS